MSVSNNTTTKNDGIFSLAGQSIKTPIKVTVQGWTLVLELLEDLSDNKDAIKYRIIDICRVIDIGFGAIETSVRAALSQAAGRTIRKEDIDTQAKRDALLDEILLPSFKEE